MTLGPERAPWPTSRQCLRRSCLTVSDRHVNNIGNLRLPVPVLVLKLERVINSEPGAGAGMIEVAQQWFDVHTVYIKLRSKCSCQLNQNPVAISGKRKIQNNCIDVHVRRTTVVQFWLFLSRYRYTNGVSAIS